MIYLDNAASTPCLDCAMDAMQDVNKQWSNVHRGLHSYADYTTTKYEEARDIVAKFIGAEREQIVFTSGTTDSINMVAQGLSLSRNERVLVTRMDHHSNIAPWQLSEADVFTIPVDRGEFDFVGYTRLLAKWRPTAVAFPSVSNVLGTINKASKIIDIAHGVNAVTVMDAAQSVPYLQQHVNELHVDYMAFSGHKLHGPTGIGVLYCRNHERLRSTRVGGGMLADINSKHYTPKKSYQGLEAGTPPIQQAIGLARACQYWMQIGMNKVWEHVSVLTWETRERLTRLPGVNVLEAGLHQIGIISFTVDGIHAHDVADLLSRRGIAVRAGHHCALLLHRALRIKASVRVSFSYFNTMEEIDALIDALRKIQKEFR